MVGAIYKYIYVNIYEYINKIYRKNYINECFSYIKNSNFIERFCSHFTLGHKNFGNVFLKPLSSIFTIQVMYLLGRTYGRAVDNTYVEMLFA